MMDFQLKRIGFSVFTKLIFAVDELLPFIMSFIQEAGGISTSQSHTKDGLKIVGKLYNHDVEFLLNEKEIMFSTYYERHHDISFFAILCALEPYKVIFYDFLSNLNYRCCAFLVLLRFEKQTKTGIDVGTLKELEYKLNHHVLSTRAKPIFVNTCFLYESQDGGVLTHRSDAFVVTLGASNTGWDNSNDFIIDSETFHECKFQLLDELIENAANNYFYGLKFNKMLALLEN